MLGHSRDIYTNMDVDAMAKADTDKSLASMWESDQDVRFFLRQEGALIRWPKPSQMGVINLACLGLNHRVMSIVADWHCPAAASCKAPYIKTIKEQVHGSLHCMFETVWSSQSSAILKRERPYTCKACPGRCTKCEAWFPYRKIP